MKLDLYRNRPKQGVAVMILIVSVNLHTLRSYFVNWLKQAENLLDQIYDLPHTPKKINVVRTATTELMLNIFAAIYLLD